jgi:NAD(P)-dependent dehydrogenase (short-subunit alcohol dehydrogenase family)
MTPTVDAQKIIVITGGSRGIGAATARLAAQQGYTVGINYHQQEAAANAVVNDIIRLGGKACAVQADVSREAEVMAMFETFDKQLGPLTALVNNVGVLQQKRLLDMSGVQLEQLFATNVVSSFLCAREAVKRMSVKRGGKGGAIVNVSSMAARLGSPHEYIDYAATKGAIDTFTIGLAKEVIDDGIRVNAVRPGLIHTDIHAQGGEADRIERLKDTVPMKRGGFPEEVAAAILWLLSAQASYSTGTFIDVSGGR